MAGLSVPDACARADLLMQRFGLDDRDRRVFGYSSGMRVRLGLARALLAQPKLLILDEPSRSLDPIASSELQHHLRELAQEGTTVMLSSHRLDEVEAVCDRVLVLIDGHQRAWSTMAELTTGKDSAASLAARDARNRAHLMMADARSSVRRMRAIARRDALLQVSYQFNLLFFVSTAFFSAFIAYFVSDLVDSDLLAQYGGSYFDFVIVGLALTSYAGLGVAAFTDQIRQEQGAGTLEVLLGGPTGIGTLLAGGFIVPLALTTVEVAAVILVGVGLLGVGLSLDGVADLHSRRDPHRRQLLRDGHRVGCGGPARQTR